MPKTELWTGIAIAAALTAAFAYARGSAKKSQKRKNEVTASALAFFEPSRTRTIETPSAKYTCYEYGPPVTSAKSVILYLHGVPGSRLVPIPGLNALCLEKSILLISPDRIGFGDSKRFGSEESNNVSEFNKFATELFHKLDVEAARFVRVIVVGYSLGAPLALGLLQVIPPDSHRVSSVHIIAPVGFTSSTGSLAGVVLPNRVSHWMVRYAPNVLKGGWAVFGSFIASGDGYIDAMIAGSGKADRDGMTDLDILAWKLTTRETMKQGTRAFVSNVLEFFGKDAPSGWGFNVRALLKDHENIPVHFYHGNHDVITPIFASEELVELLGLKETDALTAYPDPSLGHFGIVKKVVLDIVSGSLQ
ncbi:Alpha/Beta hydrolase protein [Obelidium mucronatum]|nr:Alpha/Beta hydrolase protein [Obelidium mucronatum]